MIKKSYL